MIGSISRPLRELESRLADITTGEGDLTATVDQSGSDEVSRTAGLFNQFVGQIAGVVRLVAESSQGVAASAEELSATSTSISASSEETSVQAATVAEAARQVSANVETEAAGAEQMGASISEIAQNAAEAARVAGRGVEVVSGASTTVEQLGESSRQIGDVIKVIASIAEQTNLAGHAQCRLRDQRHRRCHAAHQRLPAHRRRGGRRADRNHPGDVPQRRPSCHRVRRDRGQTSPASPTPPCSRRRGSQSPIKPSTISPGCPASSRQSSVVSATRVIAALAGYPPTARCDGALVRGDHRRSRPRQTSTASQTAFASALASIPTARTTSA